MKALRAREGATRRAPPPPHGPRSRNLWPPGGLLPLRSSSSLHSAECPPLFPPAAAFASSFLRRSWANAHWPLSASSHCCLCRSLPSSGGGVFLSLYLCLLLARSMTHARGRGLNVHWCLPACARFAPHTHTYICIDTPLRNNETHIDGQRHWKLIFTPAHKPPSSTPLPSHLNAHPSATFSIHHTHTRFYTTASRCSSTTTSFSVWTSFRPL